jgi:hypothetical protein
MIAHMSKTHGECPSCDVCAKYFGTFKILKEHNKTYHKEFDSEPEDLEDINGAEVVHPHGKKTVSHPCEVECSFAQSLGAVTRSKDHISL